MAVKKPYESAFGVTFPEAYWMLSGFSVQKAPHANGYMIVYVYTSEQTRRDGREPISTFAVDFPEGSSMESILTGGLSAMYALLKQGTLAGGEDV